MDRGFGSASNLRYMIDSNMSFLIPGRRSTRCVKDLMSRLVKERDDQDRVRIHDGVVYAVIEAEVAIVPRSKGDEDDSKDAIDL